MSADDIAALIAARVVEEVAADGRAARRNLLAAEAHLKAAATIASDDPTGAFALAYDAIRKAISAHMSANGLRVTSRPGSHQRTGRYARAALDAHEIDEHLSAFDDLRRVRNKTEYDALIVTESTARDAIVHAHGVVAAVVADLAAIA